MEGRDTNALTKQWGIMKSTSVKQERMSLQVKKEGGRPIINGYLPPKSLEI